MLRRAIVLLCCLLAQPALALTAAQELLLFGGNGLVFYANPAANGVIPAWLAYASTNLRYYWDASGTLRTSPNNQLTYSNTFTNAAWTTSGVTVSGGVTDPNGGTGAYSVLATSSSSGPGVINLAAATAGAATIGVVNVQANGLTWVGIYNANNASTIVWFNLTGACTVGTVQTNVSYYGCTALGGGWYQIYVAWPGSALGAKFGVFPSTGGDNSFSVTNTGTGINVYQASLATITAATTSPRAGDQVVTTTNAYFGPVVNDHNPSTLAALGLRSEPQRTNLFLNNTAPATQTITVANATQYTISFYGTGTEVLTGACTTTMTGSAGVRTSYTCTTVTTSLVMTATSLGASSYAQVEQNAFATSPILTYGSAVTIPADNWSFVGAALGQLKTGKFCIVIEHLAEGIGTVPRFVDVSDGTSNNNVGAYYIGTTTMTGFYTIAGSTSNTAGANGGDITTAARIGAISSTATTLQTAYDGTLVSATSHAPYNQFTQAVLGNRADGTRAAYGWFSQIAIRQSCTAAQVRRYSTAGANLRAANDSPLAPWFAANDNVSPTVRLVSGEW